MTKTYVIQGGTDGIGAAVARALFLRGDHAVILGTNPEKAAPCSGRRRALRAVRTSSGRI